jgi:hypothetical protein
VLVGSTGQSVDAEAQVGGDFLSTGGAVLAAAIRAILDRI